MMSEPPPPGKCFRMNAEGELPPAPGATTATAPVPRTAEARLRELQELRDEGLLTPEEYDARRTAVLDSV